jgi:hypothetical protein
VSNAGALSKSRPKVWYGRNVDAHIPFLSPEFLIGERLDHGIDLARSLTSKVVTGGRSYSWREIREYRA